MAAGVLVVVNEIPLQKREKAKKTRGKKHA